MFVQLVYIHARGKGGVKENKGELVIIEGGCEEKNSNKSSQH